MADKPTVYIETTIPSFLTARPSGDLIAAGRQYLTQRWWEQRRSNFRLFVSQYVMDEAGRGDPGASKRRMDLLKDVELLEVDADVIRLAQTIVVTGIIPAKASTDAGHVAVAARYGMDFLMTWNCAHIANAEIIKKVGVVVQKAGYELPLICTPEELFGEDENEG